MRTVRVYGTEKVELRRQCIFSNTLSTNHVCGFSNFFRSHILQKLGQGFLVPYCAQKLRLIPLIGVRYKQWLERLASVGILEGIAYGLWSLSFTVLYRSTQVWIRHIGLVRFYSKPASCSTVSLHHVLMSCWHCYLCHVTKRTLRIMHVPQSSYLFTDWFFL